MMCCFCSFLFLECVLFCCTYFYTIYDVEIAFINPPAIKYAKISVRNNKPPLKKVFVSVPRILFFFFFGFFFVSV